MFSQRCFLSEVWAASEGSGRLAACGKGKIDDIVMYMISIYVEIPVRRDGCADRCSGI